MQIDIRNVYVVCGSDDWVLVVCDNEFYAIKLQGKVLEHYLTEEMAREAYYTLLS